ncbi:MAG: FAD-dependent oxidoreductase [Candidatus Omnitrophica bacterium]|nr:FAD-dependent oxidoreductase [Candidatus Omnitrophota bacterium]
MKADIVVVGAGPGGMAAAWTAAKSGAETLLVERYGFCGGMATTGIIGSILGHYLNEKEPAVAGFLKVLVEKMAQLGGCEKWENVFKKYGISFDSEILKYAAEQVLCDAGVKFLYHSYFSKAKVSSGHIDFIEVVNKNGTMEIEGKFFIDATGDADIAYFAGFECTKGRPQDEKTESMGSIFKIAGIDEDKLTEQAIDEARRKLSEFRKSGELKIFNEGLGGKGSTIRKGERSFNMTRYAGDATNAIELTNAEIFLRKETFKIYKFFKENVPGFENSYISAFNINAGVRETRQIKGLYTLTEQDVIEGRKNDDSVARCTYWIDIHCPFGRTINTHLCYKECQTSEYCVMLDKYRDYLPSKDKLYPPDNDWFSIPSRCLMPEKAKNLLVAGRCISADHKAMGATRVMATCMATGDAAGAIASVCLNEKCDAQSVPVKKAQKTIEQLGGLF